MREMKIEHVLLFLVGVFLVYHMMKGCGCKEGWMVSVGSPTDEHCVLKESHQESITDNKVRQQVAMAAKCASANDLPGNVLKGKLCQGSRYTGNRPTTDPNWRNVDHCKWENGTCSVDTSSPSWNSLDQAVRIELMEKGAKCDSANTLLMRQLPGRKCSGDAALDPDWRDVDYCEVSNDPGYNWPSSARGRDDPPAAHATHGIIPGQTDPRETRVLV